MIVNTLTLEDSDFPETLKQLPQPPRQLYWAGEPPSNWVTKPRLAVVGSRKMSPYGQQVTQQLVAQLAQAGAVIISGLAFGIDSVAHNSTLAVSGQTVAVLPGPIDEIYPAAHRQLATDIVAKKGTLVSEYQSGTPIYKQSFIARNRIIGALADAVLITEAAINSGSLHTARFALEQGKTVLAVPGNITNSNSQGVNNLIKSGAIPVTHVSDILFVLGISPMEQTALGNYELSEAEQKIVDLIRSGISDQDELARRSGLMVAMTNSTLTMLELNGIIKPVGGGQWLMGI